MTEKKKSVQQIAQDKERKIMETVAWRAGYYRANPQRMVNDVLFNVQDFTLRWFQKLILWAMFHYNFVMYLAARG